MMALAEPPTHLPQFGQQAAGAAAAAATLSPAERIAAFSDSRNLTGRQQNQGMAELEAEQGELRRMWFPGQGLQQRQQQSTQQQDWSNYHPGQAVSPMAYQGTGAQRSASGP